MSGDFEFFGDGAWVGAVEGFGEGVFGGGYEHLCGEFVGLAFLSGLPPSGGSGVVVEDVVGELVGECAAPGAVADSVHNGSARDKVTKKSRRVGYARVLSGKESCAFCAMLASRGPVYSEDTVVRRRDGRRYHDNCDCVAVLVVHGQPWEGQAEYEALEQAWRTHAGSKDQFKNWSRAVSGGKVDPRKYSPFTGEWETGAAPPKLGSVKRGGSKNTIRSAVSKANPTGDENNCVRCVNAWGMRRAGYDIQAIPGQPGMSAKRSTETWRDSQGKRPNWKDARRDEGALKWPEIRQQLADSPDGSWGYLRYTRDDFGQHVVAWEVRDGTLEIIDPQYPDANNEIELENAVPDKTGWVNLTGFRPTIQTAYIVDGRDYGLD